MGHDARSNECKAGELARSSRESLVARVRELCEAPVRSQGVAACEQLGLIEEFELYLGHRFAAAELAQGLGSLACESPAMLERVDQLHAEHRDMMAELEALLDLARERPDASELAKRLCLFLERLDINEREERAFFRALLASSEARW